METLIKTLNSIVALFMVPEAEQISDRQQMIRSLRLARINATKHGW